MKPSRWLGMVAGGAFWALACGVTTGGKTSSSSHWIQCDMDRDCDSVTDAVACEAGFCVDESGERIENDALGGAGAPGEASSFGGATTNGVTGSGGLSDLGFGDQGTSSTGGNPLGFTTCVVNDALQTCQGSICHGSPGVAPALTLGSGLDLFREDRDTWLVDRPATYSGVTADPEACPAVPERLVDTENPNDSLIIKKIEGRQECGASEPITQVDRFSDADRKCVTDWVLWLATGGE